MIMCQQYLRKLLIVGEGLVIVIEEIYSIVLYHPPRQARAASMLSFDPERLSFSFLEKLLLLGL
jgi:hypothetical protein